MAIPRRFVSAGFLAARVAPTMARPATPLPGAIGSILLIPQANGRAGLAAIAKRPLGVV